MLCIHRLYDLHGMYLRGLNGSCILELEELILVFNSGGGVWEDGLGGEIEAVKKYHDVFFMITIFAHEALRLRANHSMAACARQTYIFLTLHLFYSLSTVSFSFNYQFDNLITTVKHHRET